MLGIYRQDGHEMARHYLSDEAYEEFIRGCVIVCTDAVIVDWVQRTLWLACRRVQPMPGPWVIGGRRFAGETKEASVQRCFRRETKVDIPGHRFQYLDEAEYVWSSREQAPQEVGCHNLVHIFSVALKPEERLLVASSLIGSEYEQDFGLQEYDRNRLIKEATHPVLTDIYGKLYPEKKIYRTAYRAAL